MAAMTALFGALALFWLSTRQFALLSRALIWVAGAVMLAWAAFGQAAPSNEFGLQSALEDLWRHREAPSEAAIVQAFKNNAVTVTRFVPQLLDFFVVAGAIMGALTLLAFTRGEALEKALRPTILALVGFIAGSTATLAVVAIGLGGQVKPRTFIGTVAETAASGEPSVYDGDTFWLGEISLRLWGVDAPELGQECRGLADCGAEARAQLASYLGGALVQCDQHQSLRSGRLTESFGRPLVRCWRLSQGRREDVGAWMIRNGFDMQYENNDRYGYAEEARDGRGRGVMRACSLQPHIWRRDRAVRVAFEAGATPAPEQAMGDCAASPYRQGASP